MAKLIGYARVSTLQQFTDRKQVDILAADVRRDDLYIDRGVAGARASRPDFDQALDALEDGDTLVIMALDRLGRSTQNMLTFAEEVRGRGAGLRVLRLGSGDARTAASFLCSRGHQIQRAPHVPSGLHPFLPVAHPPTSRPSPRHGPCTAPSSQSPSALQTVIF